MKARWQRKKLADVLKIQNGYAFDSKKFNPSKGMPLVRIRSLKLGIETETWFNGPYDEKYVVQAGDLLIGMDGEFGCFEWKGNPSLLNQRVCRLQDFTGELIPKFIFYGINEYLKAIEDVTGFATVKHLSSKQVLDIDFPVPPLPEQQRIVAILDEAFAGIATARANAEQNRQNARALFESHLQSIFADAWQTGELVTLADLAIEITDGDHMPPPKALSGVPFITIGNIAKNTRTIDFTDTFMVSKEYFDRLKPNKKPQKGDVLYTVTGSFGIPVLLSEHRDFCFQRHIGLVRPKPEVNSEWLCHLLLSPQIFKQANDGATGTAQKTISLKLLRGYQVPRIPLALQHAVVTKLNTVSKETQRLESLYQQKIAALDELKKSLLHQAFSGAL